MARNMYRYKIITNRQLACMMMRAIWNCRSWSPSRACDALHSSCSGWL